MTGARTTRPGRIVDGAFVPCGWPTHHASPLSPCIGRAASSGCTCRRWTAWDLALGALYGVSANGRYELHRKIWNDRARFA